MQHGPARADQPFHNSATGHASGWILQGHSHEVPEFYDKGTFFLRFGFDKGTLKQKGQKGTTQEPRTEHRLGCSPWKPHFRDGAPCRRGIGDQGGTPSEHFSPSSHCHPDKGSRVGLKRARVAAPACCALHPASGVRGLRNLAGRPQVRRRHAQFTRGKLGS